jgi:hypothetical protein
VFYKSTAQSVTEYGGVCFSGMSECHIRRLERIQLRVETLTILLSVEVLAGFPLLRQRFSFLNGRFLVSALVKAKRFGETRRTPIEPGTIRTAFPNGRFSAFLRTSTQRRTEIKRPLRHSIQKIL